MVIKSAFIFLFYAAVGFLEIVPLKKEKRKNKLYIYSSLLSISALISILITLGVKIPSPAVPIKQIIISMFGE